ncbi:alpha/beta hydrolase family protein [Hyphococcus luteus]|uniref:alpha/beta hydrolase family protein n=1 Tax=Hyphococcus luteus TaxID=2058213 RepID=UPI0013FD4303|nr:hypothetical protein [Marinicaulis flavus]
MPAYRSIRSAILLASFALALSGCAIARAGDAGAAKASEAQSHPDNDYSAPGPYRALVRYDVWTDEERGRDIKVKLYAPETDEPAPVVIFSHGLGGSVEAAPYFGKQLSSHGFLVIYIQHPGSDAEVWRGKRGRAAILAALRKATKKPATTINRYNDVPFVIDEIEARTVSGDLNADVSRIGIAGHSFGAHTVLALLGRRYQGIGEVGDFKEPRLRAGMALSPPSPGPRVKPDDYDFVYGAIDRPILHVTGTEDANPLDESDAPINRTIPFAEIDGAPQYLLVFDGADHAVFGGASGPRAKAWYPDIRTRTAVAATAFFDAYLKHDEEARAWLDGPSAKEAFAEGARFERRRP